MRPDIAAALEATWPAASFRDIGPFRLRDGAGGGKRVSAATVLGAWDLPDLLRAEAAMDGSALFRLDADDTALDNALAARGYRKLDPTLIYAAPVAGMQAALPPLACFAHWPPLEIAHDLWAEADIGPARLAIMHRVAGDKTAILSRCRDRIAGIAFVACDGSIAMLHALEVTPALRRLGAARNILHAAANWAADRGADTLALAVTVANSPARALYASFGMQGVGQYHYRQK